MLNKLMHIFLLIIFCSLFGCTNLSVSNSKEYNEWLNNTENGCKVSKEVNGMIVDVKFLPSNYLALKEFESEKKLDFDSLLKTYQNSTTFLITFKPKEGHKGDDIMFKNVADYKGYIERTLELNFDLESKIVLKTNNGTFSPVLSSLENTYGLTKGRQVYMVFADKTLNKEIQNSPSLDLIYTDDTYQLGILHFPFAYSKIKNTLPKIN